MSKSKNKVYLCVWQCFFNCFHTDFTTIPTSFIPTSFGRWCWMTKMQCRCILADSLRGNTRSLSHGCFILFAYVGLIDLNCLMSNFKRIFASPHKPSVLLSFSELLCRGLMEYIEASEGSWPLQTSVISPYQSRRWHSATVCAGNSCQFSLCPSSVRGFSRYEYP